MVTILSTPQGGSGQNLIQPIGMIYADRATLYYDTLTGLPFQPNMTITTVSGMTAVVVTDNGVDSMVVKDIVGFQFYTVGDSFTNGTGTSAILRNIENIFVTDELATRDHVTNETHIGQNQPVITQNPSPPTFTPSTTLQAVINYNNLVGTFAVGDTVTGPNGTGIITFDDGGATMVLDNVVGSFLITDAISGNPSGATADVANAYSSNDIFISGTSDDVAASYTVTIDSHDNVIITYTPVVGVFQVGDLVTTTSGMTFTVVSSPTPAGGGDFDVVATGLQDPQFFNPGDNMLGAPSGATGTLVGGQPIADTFSWSDSIGGTASLVPITGAPQLLSHGVSVTFDINMIGQLPSVHNLNDDRQRAYVSAPLLAEFILTQSLPGPSVPFAGFRRSDANGDSFMGLTDISSFGGSKYAGLFRSSDTVTGDQSDLRIVPNAFIQSSYDLNTIGGEAFTTAGVFGGTGMQAVNATGTFGFAAMNTSSTVADILWFAGNTSFVLPQALPQLGDALSVSSILGNEVTLGFAPAGGLITSVANTSTINLQTLLGVLTADFVSNNISQFINDVPYLTTAVTSIDVSVPLFTSSGAITTNGTVAMSFTNPGFDSILGSTGGVLTNFTLGTGLSFMTGALNVTFPAFPTFTNGAAPVLNDLQTTLNIVGNSPDIIVANSPGTGTLVFSLANAGPGAMGPITNATVSIDAQGRVTALSSGTSGVLTLSAIGATPNANAATITGTVLNLQPADATFGGVLTAGTQTIGGAKTFVNALSTQLGLNVGGSGGAPLFQVNSSGNIVLLNNVVTSFPSFQGGVGEFLQNNGSGVLTRQPQSTIATAVPISGLTAAIATNNINNVDFAQQWNWNARTGASAGLRLFASGNTHGAGAGNALFEVSSSGTTTAGATTYTQIISNGFTNVTGTNVGLLLQSALGLNNIALLTPPANGSYVLGANASDFTPVVGGTFQIGSPTGGTSGMKIRYCDGFEGVGKILMDDTQGLGYAKRTTPSFGTVTSVSVVSANGVSGSVATATTTPAITLTLGAITPTSVNGNTITTGTGTLTLSTFTLTVAGTASISGTHTGTSSGTNTGDQTITLTGDVTGSGTGSFATTIANNAVTYAKMQAVSATSKLLGSSSTTTAVQEITLGTGLSMTGTTLNAAGILTLSAIGSSPNANAATITGTVLNLQPASSSFGGVVTTGSQVFAGAKQFDGLLIAAGGVNAGTAAQFVISTTGDVNKINNVAMFRPSTQGAADTFLKNDGTGILTWTTPLATASGTYTPTAANNTNLDSNPTPSVAQWMRVGSTVTVSGRVSGVDPTGTGGASFSLSLPVASAFATADQCAGTAFSPTLAGFGAAINADTGTGTAFFAWIAVDITSRTISYTYTYTVI